MKSIEYLSNTNGGIRYKNINNTTVVEENLNEISIYNSNGSVHSSDITGQVSPVLFLGFEDSWERDLWSQWLIEVRKRKTIFKKLKVVMFLNEILLHVFCNIVAVR